MENKDYTLLVVDDGDENRDMLSRRLKRRGFQVLAAEHGKRALEVVEANPVDLVLLDIMMPEMDGIEVLRRLRRTWSQDEMPVIMQTAKGDSDDVVEALDLGANDYVTKPIDFAVLLARVQSQLRTKDRATEKVSAAIEKAAESSAGEVRPGAVLAGKYLLGDAIGSGTFGSVYHAKHIELDDDVAVKILRQGVSASEEARIRFRREGVSACRVKHPNAVAVSDFGVTAAGDAYLVMELLRGNSLAEELKRKGVMTPRRCYGILQPICDVLEESHQAGIVHRDIKPENIFLHRTSRGEIVKVLDFGIAKLVGDTVESEGLTAEGFILGTPAYMAPERLTNAPYDGRSDVYSLGIMLFLMLSGRLPFVPKEGDPMSLLMMHVNDPMPALREVAPEVPEAIEDILFKATRKLSDERPGAAELAREFAAALGIEMLAPQVAEDSSGAVTIDLDETAPTLELARKFKTPAGDQGLLGRFLKRFRR